MLSLLWCSSGTCVCRDGALVNSLAAGLVINKCCVQLKGRAVRAGCSSVLQGQSLPPLKLAPLWSKLHTQNRFFRKRLKKRGDKSPCNWTFPCFSIPFFFWFLYRFSIKCLLVASYNNQILYFLFCMGNTLVQFPVQLCGLLSSVSVQKCSSLKGTQMLKSDIMKFSPFSK